jgi:hypothetical protein
VRDILQDQKQVSFVPFSGIAYIDDLLTIAIAIVVVVVIAVASIVFRGVWVVVFAVFVGTSVAGGSRFVFVFVLSAPIRPFVVIVGIEVFDPLGTYHLDHPY